MRLGGPTPSIKDVTMVSTTVLCLPLTMGRASAQLAQCAACLVRRALRNPPKPRGSVTVSRIAGSTSGEIWQLAPKQRQMPSSWPAVNSSINLRASPRATGGLLDWKHCATKTTRSGCPAKLGCVPTVFGAFSTPVRDEPPRNPHVPTEFQAP